MPIFTLINIINARSGMINRGSKVGKGENIIKLIKSKNHSDGPIFMSNSQKILKLAYVLKFIGKKLHVLGVGLVCAYSDEKLKLRFKTTEKLSFKDEAIFSPILERSRVGEIFFGIIR